MSEWLQSYKEQTCCHEKPESRLMERMLDPDLTLSLVQELWASHWISLGLHLGKKR